MKQMAKCVKPGGILAMTVDFAPKYNTGPGLRSVQDIMKRIVEPSELKLLDDFVEHDKNVACGAIFLTKEKK